MKSRQRGTSLIEIIGALAIGSIMLAGLTAVIDASLEDAEGQQAALYQSQVVAAARKYIAVHYTDLIAATPTAASVAAVPIDTLKTESFLPAGFSTQNAFLQSTCILVRQPTAGSGKLDALIATFGGSAIADKNIPAVAANAGQGSGYIPASDPTTARGASWSMVTTAYRSVPCAGGGPSVLTGAATDGGHLVSNLFYDGPGNVSTDFLYRKDVPGRPELNQMNTPIHMVPGTNAEAVEGSTTDPRCMAAGDTGKIAVDAAGHVLSCQSGTWKRQGSGYWKDPVATYAALPASGNDHGDVRMVLALNRAFTWTGAAWTALAVDQNGNLSVPARLTAQDAMFNRVVVAKTACNASDPDGTVARDASGLVMSCQYGLWQSQTNLALQASDSDCAMILPSSQTVFDPPCTKAYTGTRTWIPAVDTWVASVTRPVTPTKNGLINASVWSQMNRGLYNDPTVAGQFSITLEIINSDTGLVIAGTRAQSTRIQNDSMTINATLAKAVNRNNNGYVVKINTYWTTYDAGAPPYNRSNYQNWDGTIVEQLPLSTGWNVDLFQ